MPPSRRRYSFAGKVQGVGFRATAQHVARGHQVTGWVRNEPDRSVALEVQGDAAVIDRYITELRGVLHANITNMTSIDVPPVTGENSFEVVY